MNASMNDTHNLCEYMHSPHCLQMIPNCTRSVEVNTRSKGMGRSFPAEDCKGFYVLRSADQPLMHEQYEFERRKYAQELINFDKKFAKLFSGKPRTDEHQEGVSHEEFLE